MSGVFIEQQIIDAVRGLLTGRVNELLGELENNIPLFEFNIYRVTSAVVPSVFIMDCESTEKERIIKLNAYTLTIKITLPETVETEIYLYSYSNAISKAINENSNLGGVAERALITNKKYILPKQPFCGLDWEMVITLRVTVEGIDK